MNVRRPGGYSGPTKKEAKQNCIEQRHRMLAPTRANTLELGLFRHTDGIKLKIDFLIPYKMTRHPSLSKVSVRDKTHLVPSRQLDQFLSNRSAPTVRLQLLSHDAGHVMLLYNNIH